MFRLALLIVGDGLSRISDEGLNTPISFVNQGNFSLSWSKRIRRHVAQASGVVWPRLSLKTLFFFEVCCLVVE